MQITDENIRELKEVVRRETPRLLRLPRVLSVGVALKFRNGIPTQTLCIRVTVKKKKLVEPENTNIPRIEDVIRVPGYPVDMIEIEDKTEPSEPRVCDVPEFEARTGTYDVLKGGMAIYTEQYGVKQSYGTLGMVVFDRRSCLQLILTSRDILRSLPLSGIGQKEHPEEIFQGDGNEPVGKDLRGDFVYGESNGDLTLHSDFLVAAPIGDREVSPDVEGIEFERIFMEPKLGMKVWKSGARSGVTQGIITQLNGFEFIVGNQTSASFSCFGDTGAIVFGEKDGVKRPLGMVTRFYEEETKEVRCVSLRPALMANPWLDISLKQECLVDIKHRFWNPIMNSSYYCSLDSVSIDESLGPMYEYIAPDFIGENPYDLKSVPLYSWFNSSSKKHYYSIDKAPPKYDDSYNPKLLTMGESNNGVNSNSYSYTGILAFSFFDFSKNNKVKHNNRKPPSRKDQLALNAISEGLKKIKKTIVLSEVQKSLSNFLTLTKEPKENELGMMFAIKEGGGIANGIYKLYFSKYKLTVSKPSTVNNGKIIDWVKTRNKINKFTEIDPKKLIYIPSLSIAKGLIKNDEKVSWLTYIIDFIKKDIYAIDEKKAGWEVKGDVLEFIARTSNLKLSGGCTLYIESKAEVKVEFIFKKEGNPSIAVDVTSASRGDVTKIGSVLIDTLGAQFGLSLTELVYSKQFTKFLNVGAVVELEPIPGFGFIIEHKGIPIKLSNGTNCNLSITGKITVKALTLCVKTIPRKPPEIIWRYYQTARFLMDLQEAFSLSFEDAGRVFQKMVSSNTFTFNLSVATAALGFFTILGYIIWAIVSG